VLRDAGIVSSERRGTRVYYRIEPDARLKLRSFEELVGP
jgi:DNA-binding transcriptional ArsR family regulator